MVKLRRPAILIDTGPTQWPLALDDFAGCVVGQLLTPLTRYRLHDPSRPWAIDNGGYGSQDPAGLASLLQREAERRSSCLFVSVPDVVMNGRRTLELFERFENNPMLAGWPKALVLQNGVEDLDIPWRDVSAVFVGGDDAFKESAAVADCLKAARWLGIHTHVGRVNTSSRLNRLASYWPLADTLGMSEHGIDTIDGTGLSRYSHMRRDVRACIVGDEDDQLTFGEVA